MAKKLKHWTYQNQEFLGNLDAKRLQNTLKLSKKSQKKPQDNSRGEEGFVRNVFLHIY